MKLKKITLKVWPGSKYNCIFLILIFFLINYFNFNFIIGNSSEKENNPIALDSQSIAEISYFSLIILYNISKIKKIIQVKKILQMCHLLRQVGLFAFFLRKLLYN